MPLNQQARRIALAVALGGGLALGAAGLAYAADPAPSTSPSQSAEAGGPARGEPREHKPHLAGTVKSISDTRITITDREGFTRQINITSKPDGVAVGTRIHAEGTVNADGVSLDATTVGVAPEGIGRGGPGGPGHGPGGRGGHGPRGEAAPTPPSGAPTPPSGAPTPPSAAPSGPVPSATS